MPSRSESNRQMRFSGRSLIATLLVVQIASPMYILGQQTTTPQQTPAQTPTPQTQIAPPVAPRRPLPDPSMDQQAGAGMQQPAQAPVADRGGEHDGKQDEVALRGEGVLHLLQF